MADGQLYPDVRVVLNRSRRTTIIPSDASSGKKQTEVQRQRGPLGMRPKGCIPALSINPYVRFDLGWSLRQVLQVKLVGSTALELPARDSDERWLHRTAVVALASAYLAAPSVLVFGSLVRGSSAPPHWLLRVHFYFYLPRKQQADSDVTRSPERARILWAFTPEAWRSRPVYSGSLMIASYTGCVGLTTAFTSASAPAESWRTALGYFTIAGLSLGLHCPARWAFRRQQPDPES